MLSFIIAHANLQWKTNGGFLRSYTKDPRCSPVARGNHRWPWFPRTFKIVYYFASSVQLMTWILLHVLAFHPLERLRWSLAWISSLPMGFSPSYLFWWQLMWWVTTDVAVSVCGRSGLWPFRFVAVPVCSRFGLWPFRFVAVWSVAVPVCGRFGLWPFRFVAVSVCGRFGCGRFGLWPLWPVTLCNISRSR